MTNPALELTGVTKTYGANTVLRGVDLSIAPGEIHALLGENGAGKSTIIKILAGVVQRDAGEISVSGDPLPSTHTADEIQRAGVAFVHQNLGLLDSLSVADNVGLYAGFERTWRGISRKASRRKAIEFLEQVGNIRMDPDRLVGDLSQDEKVLVAIARAFALDPRVIVLDEVSASLPAPEMDRLAGVLRQARQRGVAYVFVTHRLAEVYDLADRMTILRDGRVALSAPVREVTHAQAVEAIVGRSVAAAHALPDVSVDGPPALQVNALRGPGIHTPISFAVRPGEVVGVCGLVGSGTRTLARLLGGADRAASGEVTLEGRAIALGVPAAMNRAGVAYVPGQRQREGVFPELTVRENFFPLRKQRSAFGPTGVLHLRKEKSRARQLAVELEVRPAGQTELQLRELSGGNQQKVILGRALADRPRALVLEDPTAGVDVGSRRALHDLVRQAAADGAAIILISTDYDEVASESHRVLVMRDGSVVGEYSGASAEALASASHAAEPYPDWTESDV